MRKAPLASMEDLKVLAGPVRGAYKEAAKSVTRAGPIILPRVLETLKTCRDIEARSYLESVILALSKQRTRLVVEEFLEASAPVSYRVSLARVLGSSRQSRALAPEALRNGLKDQNREIRAVSAEALGTFGRLDARIIEDLRVAEQDEDPFVRECAREALDELGAS